MYYNPPNTSGIVVVALTYFESRSFFLITPQSLGLMILTHHPPAQSAILFMLVHPNVSYSLVSVCTKLTWLWHSVVVVPSCQHSPECARNLNHTLHIHV